jgi:hypothetical protein
VRLAIFFLFFTWFLFSRQYAQTPCGLRNRAFTTGEELKFKVVYNWGPIWLESAFAKFTVEETVYQKKKSYLFKGTGSTFPRYDWFYKVKDEFESIVDSASFRPMKFNAEINEGSKHDRHTYLFQEHTHKAFTLITHGTSPLKLDTIPLDVCTIDVLTAIYFARNIDYSICRVNDTIGISILLDGKLYPLYVRYLGPAEYNSPELGKFRCIKFRPLLVEGSIFRKGEHMNVWVTDDENKMPLYIETEIIVGSIKVSLTSFKGLRHPLTSRIPHETGKR